MVVEVTPHAQVFWLTGLSGSGKTSIAMCLTEELRAQGKVVVNLDGDVMREVYGESFGHDRISRYKAASCYARLCHLLSAQGVTVVCATISLFHEIHQWNRAQMPGYVEVFIDVPLQILEARDSKGLYARAYKGEIVDVVGVDMVAEYPETPDVIIANHGDMTPEEAARHIVEKVA